MVTEDEALGLLMRIYENQNSENSKIPVHMGRSESKRTLRKGREEHMIRGGKE
jgi:hypothetical protein